MISGGQFSVFRCLWGLGCAASYAFLPIEWTSLNVVLYLSLAIGYRLKICALLLSPLVFLSPPLYSLAQVSAKSLEVALLIAFFFSAPHPYLSYPYQLSQHCQWSLDTLQTNFYSYLGYLPLVLCLINYSSLPLPFILLSAFLALYKLGTQRILYPLWLLWMIALAFCPQLWVKEMTLIALFLICSPSSFKKLDIFYDGHCGLCHRAVIFLMQESPWGSARFFPLQGKTFRQIASHLPYPLPDSLGVKTQENMLFKAQALLKIGSHTGGIWQALSYAVSWIPLPLLNALYDRIAHIRHRLFTAPSQACPLFPPRLRHLFPELNSSPK